MVWWQPWRESPSPLLTCCCLMPRSSNPFPPCAWTWRETAMPSRMWMPLRCRALLTHFFIRVDRLTLLADCGWLTRVKQLPSLALTESALQKYLSSTSPKVSGWLGWYQIPFPQLQRTNWWRAMFPRTIGTHCSSKSWWTFLTGQVTHTLTSVTLQVGESSPSGWSFVSSSKKIWLSVAKPPVTIMCMTAKKDITVIIVKPLQPEIWQVLGNPDWGDPACQQSVSSGKVTHPNNWKLLWNILFGRYPEFYLRSGVWGLALLGGKEVAKDQTFSGFFLRNPSLTHFKVNPHFRPRVGFLMRQKCNFLQVW